MELFYSRDIDSARCRLDKDESMHCVKVLRHRCPDVISVIDGEGKLYKCQLVDDSPKGAEAIVLSVEEDWGGHPYSLTMAVCPTKNNDRYEWFAEKACEVGMDKVVPVIGVHSERRVFKEARLEKLLISAAKQSLKAAVPQIAPVQTVKEFILANSGKDDGILRMMAYCFEQDEAPRRSVKEVLKEYDGKEVIILIGPEGDFSREEALLALENGFIPVHLGESRLRTETAALTAVNAVYFNYMK
jgi:16S rRNA (uracil1498-N3)-methyltransferase